MTRAERTRYWTDSVERQAASGMSGRAWCRENEVNLDRFYSWRRKLAASSAGGFIKLRTGSEEAGIRIRLGAEPSIEVDRGFDPATLRAVLAALHPAVVCLA